MAIIIDKSKGVPPFWTRKKYTHTATYNSKYSIASEMKVTDSILVKKINEAIWLQEKLTQQGKRSTHRQVNGGFRVWRIS